MHVVNFTEARNNLAATIDKAVNDRAPVLITRQRGKPAVLISLEEWESWQETEYLLRSPANAARLLQAIEEVKAGKAIQRELLPDD